MRKIDKTIILSKNYKKWLDNLGNEHPKYNSSNNKYYIDIKMSLLYCQKGLCAYTEELLCDLDLITEDNWSEERYITELNNQNLTNGDLEHFDESLKEKQAWLWDNLFFVNGDINRKVKCSKAIQPILKPDSSDYDPFINIYRKL
jgi:glycogen debranching enzyme